MRFEGRGKGKDPFFFCFAFLLGVLQGFRHALRIYSTSGNYFSKTPILICIWSRFELGVSEVIELNWICCLYLFWRNRNSVFSSNKEIMNFNFYARKTNKTFNAKSSMHYDCGFLGLLHDVVKCKSRSESS